MNRFVAIVSVGIAFMLASGPLHAKQLTGGTRALARGDYVAATQSLIPRAERGDANAQARLGFMYEHGRGVAQDYSLAVYWYTCAAAQCVAPNQQPSPAAARIGPLPNEIQLPDCGRQ